MDVIRHRFGTAYTVTRSTLQADGTVSITRPIEHCLCFAFDVEKIAWHDRARVPCSAAGAPGS